LLLAARWSPYIIHSLSLSPLSFTAAGLGSSSASASLWFGVVELGGEEEDDEAQKQKGQKGKSLA
jgi:hypothetical protein